MESQIDQILRLKTEGQEFTRKNFCYPSSQPDEFGGADRPEWYTWKRRCVNTIKQVAAPDSAAVGLVNAANRIDTNGYDLGRFEMAREQFLKALELTLEALQGDVFSELATKQATPKSPALSNKVFIVHGHDELLKVELENFLKEIGLDPIVLHRQPDQGKTIIEKFEQHSDVGYAFILLTPDEYAYAADQELLPDSQRKKEKRARPNVNFEFGFFVAKLGRPHVCCLHRGGVAIPSDLHGLVYKSVEGGLESQKYSIVRELKAIGYKLAA